MGVWIETLRIKKYSVCAIGHTLRGCVDWNSNTVTALQNAEVTPFVGVWIETCLLHRLWRCQPVTPFVGVWIETLLLLHLSSPFLVTPFVGVWIETRNRASFMTPTRVTPFVGVWIETENRFYFLSPLEKVIFAKTCHWLSISYKDKKYDSGFFLSGLSLVLYSKL